MAWLELHQALPHHRKTLALADTLGIAPVYALGHLTSFWLWAIDNAPDGSLANLTPRVIGFAAQWAGDPTVFVDAMILAGFFEKNDGVLAIHDWMDYAGRLVEQRVAERERSRKRRASFISTTDKSTTGRPPDDQWSTVGTGPNTTGPDRTGPESDSVVSAETTAATAAPLSVADTLDDLLNECANPLVRNKNGVVIKAFVAAVGKSNGLDGGRIGKLSGEVGGQAELIKRVFKVGSDWVASGRRGDPVDYITKSIHNGHDRTNGRAPPANPYMTDAELAEKTRLDREQLDAIVAQDRKRWQH